MLFAAILLAATSAQTSASQSGRSARQASGNLEITDVAQGTRELARALIARDVDALVQLTPAPFSFDGAIARSAAEVRQHWAETLDKHPVDRLRLFGVEVVSYDEIVKLHGPPPARLSNQSLKSATLGIANLSGRATVVAWRKRGRGYAAFAISD